MFSQLAKRLDVVVVTRRLSGEDEYGNDVYAEVDVPLDGCQVFPRSSVSENVQARDQVVSGLILLVPASAPVTWWSAVKVGGVKYEVDGDVQPWGRDFLQASLSRVTG